MDLDTIAIEPKKLDGIVWELERAADGTLVGKVVDAPTANGCVLVVPLGAAYERALDEEMRPFRVGERAGKADDADIEKSVGRALGRTVFRGCWNLTANKQPIVWTEEKAIELMTDPRWLGLRSFVQQAARHWGSLLAREEEQAKGN